MRRCAFRLFGASDEIQTAHARPVGGHTIPVYLSSRVVKIPSASGRPCSRSPEGRDVGGPIGYLLQRHGVTWARCRPPGPSLWMAKYPGQYPLRIPTTVFPRNPMGRGNKTGTPPSFARGNDRRHSRPLKFSSRRHNLATTGCLVVEGRKRRGRRTRSSSAAVNPAIGP